MFIETLLDPKPPSPFHPILRSHSRPLQAPTLGGCTQRLAHDDASIIGVCPLRELDRPVAARGVPCLQMRSRFGGVQGDFFGPAGCRPCFRPFHQSGAKS